MFYLFFTLLKINSIICLSGNSFNSLCYLLCKIKFLVSCIGQHDDTYCVGGACRASRLSKPQSASCNTPAHRSLLACFYLILAILNYFNLSSVFILTIMLLTSSYNLIFFCLILTDAALTCLECPRGRVAVSFVVSYKLPVLEHQEVRIPVTLIFLSS